MNREIGKLVGFLVTLAAAFSLGVAPALAAPELDVTLEVEGGPEGIFLPVRHSDERLDLTATVRNSAPETLEPGALLTCEPADWGEEPTFTYRWVAGGAEVGAGETYEVQASDEGEAIQCLVTGENEGGASVSFSTPLFVVPLPSPEPPAYTDEERPEPRVSGTASAGNEITCERRPNAWSGSPTWSFEWLLDDGPANGEVTETTATTSKYKVAAEDVPGNLQCVAIATTGSGEPPTGGTVVSVSENKLTSPQPSPRPPFNENASQAKGLPFVVTSDWTAGPITLEVELPAGQQTFAYKTEQPPGGGWSCEAIPPSGSLPARARCTREGGLAPGQELPPLTAVAALGGDAPDLATVGATAFGGGAAPASHEETLEIEPALPFGLSIFTSRLLKGDGETEHVQAGGHPLEGVSDLVVNRKRALEGTVSTPFLPVEELRQLIVDLPPGIVGNQLALPELCPGVEEVREKECPPGSLVGGSIIRIPNVHTGKQIFAIEPEFGLPAEFAFESEFGNIITFAPRLRPEDGYAISLEVAPAAALEFLESTTTLCAVGVEEVKLDKGVVCRKPGEPGANPKALFTQPTSCGVPLETRVRLSSWEHPTFVEGPPFTGAPMEGCDEVPFDPTVDIEPSTDDADSGTGLDVEVSMPTDGLEDPEGISQSHLRKAEVTLPEGMAVNPSAGHGLGACEEDEIKLGTNEPISCPDSSKIGSVEIETPVIEDTLKGAVYIAEQGAVDGSLIGFYMVFDSPKNGILVKLPAKVTPDPETGQLVVTVEDSPQQPFSAVRMHFPGGDRATLLNPPECGTYEIEAKLTPWSGGKAVTRTSEFEVDEGPDGGPCPDGSLAPGFAAGAANPLAGATSPFNVHLTRPDGSQRFSALDLAMPPGLTAYLKGIPYCPEGVLASISPELGSGQDEIDDPSCPAASRLGRIVAGAGAGDTPFFVDTGRAYLAGPYKGAPLSIVAVVPAVAGPLDLGSVVVRNAVHINSETAQVRVVSDPIPTIRHGILLDVRDVRVLIDRPAFTLNPTSCAAKQVAANVKGDGGALASVANHFQVGGCGELKFKPRLYTRLFGGTKRGAFPRFRAVLMAGAGEANIARTVVTIPRSEFVEQGHFRTICTRVQFAADACPKGSVYGRVRAFSPLVDYPLEGPVRLRSSDNELPDLVMTVHGPPHQPIEATAVARIDSIRGQLRATIAGFPDVPVSKAIVMMQGGQKGLLVNSRDICKSRNRATVGMRGQNGKVSRARPVLNNSKCKRRAGKRRGRR